MARLLGYQWPRYDLFIRWKALRQQFDGWHPDINDDVRLNIRSFVAANLSWSKKLCGKLNVEWEKDRDKKPARPVKDFPWFWG